MSIPFEAELDARNFITQIESICLESERMERQNGTAAEKAEKFVEREREMPLPNQWNANKIFDIN